MTSRMQLSVWLLQHWFIVTTIEKSSVSIFSILRTLNFSYSCSFRYTSLRRDGSFGRAIRAMPLQTTATSSTKTQSGEFSSGGISTTSMSSSRRSCAKAKCCVLASSNVTSPRVRSDNGILHRMACVYRCSGILNGDRSRVPWVCLARAASPSNAEKKAHTRNLQFAK